MLFREDIKTEGKKIKKKILHRVLWHKPFLSLPEETDFIQRLMTLISQYYGFIELILWSIFLSMISTNSKAESTEFWT